MPKIAIVILNWNTTDLTKTTIDSFLKINHSGFNYQIILVDNGSKIECINELEKTYAGNKLITILKSTINQGYAEGNNIGIRYALENKYDYIMIANSDIRVDKDFLNILFNQIKENPKLFLAPKIYFESGYEFHKDRYSKSELGNVLWAMGGVIDWNNIYGSNIGIDEVDKGQYDKDSLTPDFISGCCFLVKSEIFKKIGLFDKRYFLYMEDVDLSFRAKNNGYKLKIIPNSKIWHINSGTAGAASNLQDYFISRNRILFTFKYASLRTKFAIFRESISHLIFGRPWQKIGIRDFYLSNFEKGSWGK